MKLGTNAYMFTNYGPKVPELVKFFQAADTLGYNHVRYLDHVIGIVAEKHGGIAQTPYTAKSYIHEVFTLFAYIAALTKRVELVTGVLVLTQRETCLVAKQAAEIDILSGGRLRLGVGVGYNPVEFEALNAEFKTRGKRFEEQIAVLRAFWTQEEVSYKGQWHSIRDASLSPSLGRTIPLWFGLGRRIAPYPPDAVLNRIGRLADGWMPLFQPSPEGEVCKQKVHAAARARGSKVQLARIGACLGHQVGDILDRRVGSHHQDDGGAHGRRDRVQVLERIECGFVQMGINGNRAA